LTDDWAAYYAALKDRPPRATTIFASRRFADPGRAVDLGCGGGRDSLPLLAAGWRVVAIDREESAIAALEAATPASLRTNLDARLAPFEDADWPETDLVISAFALPLAPKERFPALWRRIRDRLTPGGRFAGQFYGIRDSWARGGAPDGVVAFSRDECLGQLSGYALELFEEEEHDGMTPRGKQKHWHIFHIVARKLADGTPRRGLSARFRHTHAPKSLPNSP